MGEAPKDFIAVDVEAYYCDDPLGPGQPDTLIALLADGEPWLLSLVEAIHEE